MIVFRILLLPVRVLVAATGVALRAGLRLGRLPLKLTARLSRLLGVKGWFFLLVGLAVGLLLAPMGGRELRAKLAQLLAGGQNDDADLAEKVTFELAHAPRTWHLEQPSVRVASGRVTLQGTVADDDARTELVRVAGAIPGVAGVEDALEVAGADEPASTDPS